MREGGGTPQGSGATIQNFVRSPPPEREYRKRPEEGGGGGYPHPLFFSGGGPYPPSPFVLGGGENPASLSLRITSVEGRKQIFPVEYLTLEIFYSDLNHLFFFFSPNKPLIKDDGFFRPSPVTALFIIPLSVLGPFLAIGVV